MAGPERGRFETNPAAHLYGMVLDQFRQKVTAYKQAHPSAEDTHVHIMHFHDPLLYTEVARPLALPTIGCEEAVLHDIHFQKFNLAPDLSSSDLAEADISDHHFVRVEFGLYKTGGIPHVVEGDSRQEHDLLQMHDYSLFLQALLTPPVMVQTMLVEPDFTQAKWQDAPKHPLTDQECRLIFEFIESEGVPVDLGPTSSS